MKKLLLILISIPTIAFCQVKIGQDINGEAAGKGSKKLIIE